MRLLTPGRIPYAEAWEMQREIFDAVVRGEEEDTLVLLEHPHVFTQGRLTDKENLLFTPESLKALDAETFEIDRGGDVTYHGPGQLVGYPIINLSHFKEDLGWYLRTLEESIILLLAEYDIQGFRIKGRTGVWTGAAGNEEKICAIGIRASRWCTMHGFAFNVSTDLSYFDNIVPCGIRDKEVTSMKKILAREIPMKEIEEAYSRAFGKAFDVKLEPAHLASYA